MVTVSVVGIGRWGKNLVRCFDNIAEVAYCCHTGNSSNANQIRKQYPHIPLTDEYDAILNDPTVDAVVIATPIGTHVELAKLALEAQKDVFVEKPLASSTKGARELVELAAEYGNHLFTGYIFLYSPAMQELHDRLEDDPAVRLRANWEKYGTFEASIAESLACHDVAIGQYLFDTTFETASVIGRTGIRTEEDILDICFETTDERLMTASYDRVARCNRKSVTVITKSGTRYEFCDDELFVLQNDEYRNKTPAGQEPLLVECQAFLEWIRGGEAPPSADTFGLTVNEILDAIN